MLENYTWCSYCSYYLTNNNNEKILDTNKRHCFSNLPQNFDNIKSITIHTYYIKPTYQYADKYIKYISDMLKLKNVIIGENTFTFKAFKERSKNMLVMTLVRFLFEYIGYEGKPELNDAFFNLLFNGKCKYKNKLKRFTYFYNQLTKVKCTKNYFGENHCPNPIKVKIRDYSHFNKTNFNKYGINDFFYGKTK